MVKYCNNADLAEQGVDSKYYLLYQVWKELTAKKTVDTYQFRLMNTLSALEELQKVINQRLERYSNSNHNVDDCKSETFEIIKSDFVLKEYYPVVRTRLMNHFGEKLDTDSQLRTLLHQIDYAIKIIKPHYFENLIDSLKKSVDDNNAFEIISKANQLVSCCSNNGWSIDALHSVIGMLKDSKNNIYAWDEFKEKLSSIEKEEYYIFLPFKIRAKNAPGQKNEAARDRVLDEIRRMDITAITVAEVLFQYPFLPNKDIEKNQIYLLTSVFAYDVYSASHLAISKIANTLNILSFYNLTEPWSVRDISWFAANPSNEYVIHLKAKDLYSTYDYLEGANKIFRSSRELDKQAKPNVRAKLQAAYSYANMGKVSYAQTEKYMNTWVALESLCRTEMYENIIGNVLETVPPALCLRYIYRCFRNFAEDCSRCGVNFEFSSMTINLKNPSKEEMVKQIIETFNSSDIYEELLERCRINDLLTERCKEMHNLSTDANKMFDRIDRHYRNIKLQLSRLYRIRNEIAHSALNDNISLLRQIEHLDDYLASFVAEVVMCWERYPESTIENIFEIIKDNFREYTDIKSSKKGANPKELLKNLRETGIISLL